MLYDLIIIGSGSAGLTAAIYVARKKMNTIILTKQIGGQSLTSFDIENYPGFLKITGPELIAKMTEQVNKYGVPIEDGLTIIGIGKKSDYFLIRTAEGQDFEAKTIIIASGKVPKKIDVPGAKEFEGKGLSFCTTCDAPLFDGKDVAIIGGGNAALMAAVDLLPYARKIYVLQHRQRFIGDEILQEKLKNSGKVQFITDAETKEIKGKNFVEGLVYENLKTGEKKELAAGGVFVNIGQVPNTAFVKEFLKLNDKNEIIIDLKTNETSAPGIFAAGDATNIPYKQYIIAAGEGAKAALSAHEYLLRCLTFT